MNVFKGSINLKPPVYKTFPSVCLCCPSSRQCCQHGQYPSNRCNVPGSVCVCIFFAPYTYECLFLISSLLQRAPGTRKAGTSGYFSKVVQALDGVWLCGFAGMEFNLTSLWSGTGSARIPFYLSRSVMVRFTFH